MKNIKNWLYVLMLLFLLLNGCSTESTVISEINKKAQSSEQFISVAAYNFERFNNGTLAIRSNNIYIWIFIRFNQDADIFNQSAATARSIVYSMYDVTNKVSKVVYYFPDGTQKVNYNGVLPENFIPYEDDSWEDTSRGVAISEKKAKVKSQNRKPLQNQNWNIVLGKYDLSGDVVEEQLRKLQINKLKGFFEIWLNEEELSAIEIYKDLEERPHTIRRFWLSKGISIDLENISFDYLVQFYKMYFGEAEFDKFYNKSLE